MMFLLPGAWPALGAWRWRERRCRHPEVIAAERVFSAWVTFAAPVQVAPMAVAHHRTIPGSREEPEHDAYAHHNTPLAFVFPGP